MYVGKTARIGFTSGFNWNKNFDELTPNTLVDCNNINTNDGGISPRGGCDAIEKITAPVEVTASPGTMADSDIVGTIAWDNPNNAKVSDDVYSTVAVASSSATASPGTMDNDSSYGQKLWVNPDNAKTNNNIYATVDLETLSSIKDDTIKIIKSDGSFGSTNKADIINSWPTTNTYKSYGSSTDSWGEIWTYADINDADFGVVLSISASAAYTSYYLKATNFGFSIPADAIIKGILVEIERYSPVYPNTGYGIGFVDHIQITVYYNYPTHYLKATNFGFAIAAGNAIQGIKVEIEKKAGSASSVIDSVVKLIKADGTLITQNKASSDYWGITDAYASYGNSADLWGEYWTYADINDADFGVVLSCLATDIPSVDHIRITIYYLAGTKITGIYQFVPPGGTITPSYFVDESVNFFVDENGNYFVGESASILVGTSAGTILKNYTTTLKSGLTTNTKFHFERFYDQVIISNGKDKPQVWDGYSTYTWDIGSPKACVATLVAAAGLITAGTHSYKVVFVSTDGDSSVGHVSNTVTTIIATHGQVALTDIQVGPSWVTQRKIFRTKAGGTTYYLLTTLTNNTATTYTDNIADASLGAEPVTTSLALLPTDWGTNFPEYFIAHGRGNQQRLWAFGVNGKLNFSYASENKEIDFSNTNVILIEYLCEKLTAAGEYVGNLIFYSEKKPFVVDDTPLTLANWGPIGASWIGDVAHHRLLVATPSDVMAMSIDGNIYSVSAAQKYGDFEIASLTRPSFIHKWINEHVDLQQIDKFHAIYDPDLRAIKIFVVLYNSYQPNCCLVYFIDKGPINGWSKHTFAINHLCAALIRTSETSTKIYTGGDNGYVHNLESETLLDEGLPYEWFFTLPPLSLDDMRNDKRIDKMWLIQRPMGTESILLDNEIDNRVLPQQAFIMTGTQDILQNYSVLIGAIGKRIQPTFSGKDGKDSYLSQLLIDYTPLGGV